MSNSYLSCKYVGKVFILLICADYIFPICVGAKCCTLFSISGIIFLVIIGALIQSQPLYIKGLTDHEKAATGCFEGGL